MTTPNPAFSSNPGAPDSGIGSGTLGSTPPKRSTADLEAEIAKLKAQLADDQSQLDSPPAKADPSPTGGGGKAPDSTAPTGSKPEPKPAAFKVGDLVHYSYDDTRTGSTTDGPAQVTQVYAAHDTDTGRADPSGKPIIERTGVQYVVAPLVELGILLTADQVTAPKD